MVQIENRFSRNALALRKYFESSLTDASRRFSWEFFNSSDLYVHLRTPAAELFKSFPAFDKFTTELKNWGTKTLGCGELSPIWASLYINDCEQRWHSDRPHGPWAFVYSLTPTKRVFTGGATEILRPEVLRFWESGPQRTQNGFKNDFNESRLIETIQPDFNRLIVFDPKIPHRVSPLHGTRDPKQGRLVLHGWFTPPKTQLAGPLKPNLVDLFLGDLDEVISKLIHETPGSGHFAVELTVLPTGRVARPRFLLSSVQSVSFNQTAHLNKALQQKLTEFVNGVRFPKQKSATRITVPYNFDLEGVPKK